MSERNDDPPVPTLTTLLTLVTLAHRVLKTLPPATVPPAARPALKKFYNLAAYHGIAPDDAPHIPDDGRI
jgi:hypothetical protein